jgi:hypothetical protein
MPYGEAVLHYSDLSWSKTLLRDYMGFEPRGSEQGKLVILHEDGEIKDDIYISDTITFGDMSHDREVPVDFTVFSANKTKNTYLYNTPINNSYSFCSILRKPAKYFNMQWEPSRFNVVYGLSAGEPDFCMMRSRSSDTMPRFVFYFNENSMDKSHAEQLIKKILI